MLFLRCLMVALLVTNNCIWTMEVILKKESKALTRDEVFAVKDILKEKKYLFEDFAKEVRKKVFIENDERWKVITTDKDLTHSLLSHVKDCLSGYPYTFDRKGFDYFMRNSGGFWRASAAAVLGTPGAIGVGKDLIENNEDEKEHLKAFLFVVVRYGIEPEKASLLTDRLAWKGQDYDIVKAALDMGMDPAMSDFFNMSLTSAAQEIGKHNIVDLLLHKNEVKLSPENFMQESV
jgi:hypothetical protein